MQITVGTKVRSKWPAHGSVTYGEGPDARTVRPGTIGVVTDVHPALPGAGPGFPPMPEWYSVAIDGVTCVGFDEGEPDWEVVP